MEAVVLAFFTLLLGLTGIGGVTVVVTKFIRGARGGLR